MLVKVARQFIIFNKLLMIEQIEPEAISSQQMFNQYKELLHRVATFKHITFYNRKLVNPYTIASNGFKKNISRNGHPEAKCVDCGHTFMLDPIVEDETMQVKDPIDQALKDHKDSCRFYTASQSKNIMTVNYSLSIDYGALLFNQIITQNLKHKELLAELGDGKEKLSMETKYQQMVKNLCHKNRCTESIYIISLLGWKIRDSKLLQCQFCGQTQILSQFDLWGGHRSFCIIQRQKHWKSILSKLSVDQLNQIEGEFHKTEVEVLAKNIRDELETKANIAIGWLGQMRYRIAGIRQDPQISDHEPHEEAAADGQKTAIRKLSEIQELTKEMERFLKSAIKKIKIN